MKFSTIWETNHFGKQFSYGETGQPLKVQYPWIQVAILIYSDQELPPTPDDKTMKTRFPVFLSIMVDIYFFRWQELPKYQKREKKPKLYASYAIRSSSFIMGDNYVRFWNPLFVCIYFVPSDKCELHSLVLDKYMRWALEEFEAFTSCFLTEAY